MIDAELIAKVLDGRATAEERARVLAEADKSPELLALLSDSAAAMAADGQAQVIPIRRPRIKMSVVVGIAAVLLAAVTLPRFLDHPYYGPPIAFDMPTTATAVAAARVGPSMSAVRGAADDDRIVQSAIAGARLVDYITLGDDTARVTAAAAIASALRAIPGGSIVASRFDVAPTVTRETIDDMEKVVDVHAFRAAGAAELLRVAAVGGDERVLRGMNVSGDFDYFADDIRLSSDARAIAQRIKTALAQRTGSSELATLASEFLTALTRPR
jgi:hypothetical protein